MSAVLAAAGAGLFALSGCGRAETGKPRMKIIATTFPVYDWTREVLGERLEGSGLVLLQQGGVDLHSYSPSAADLRQIAECDLFVFVGGASDAWAERALARQANPRRRVLNLVQALGPAAKEETAVEGMEHGHGHGGTCERGTANRGDAPADGQARHGGGREVDEHVWLSLRHAATLVRAIAAGFSDLDPDHAETYRANAGTYCAKLAALDREYAQAVSGAKRKTLLVADRFPFRYLADDYGLAYFAAFPGCSAESEASFKTIAFLAKKADELQLPVILVLEGSQHKLAETVRRTTKGKGQRILPLDSLQSVGGESIKTERYLDAMKRNLESLKAALY